MFVLEPKPIAPASPPLRPTAASVAVVVAASVAMAATLPGRTHGLGLITTRLLDDFPSIDAATFAQINLVATLLGSLFCLPCGWLVDRFGARPVMGVVMLCLAGVVLAMSQAGDVWTLAAAITLSRGVGQSMLSVISISMLSKWLRGGEAGPAMGSYAVVMTMLMAAGTGLLAWQVTALGWRAAWTEIGIALLVLAPIAWLLAKPTAMRRDAKSNDAPRAVMSSDLPSASLQDAMSTGCFWAFALSISLFGLVSSGVTLFQQLILAEQGLPEAVFHIVLVIGLLTGMAANLAGGWLSRRVSMATLLSFAMALLAGALATLPQLRTPWQAYLQASVSGVAGGLITVLFFSVWGHAFGGGHAGRIQSAAQMMTVLASAAGPLVVAWGHDYFGNYLPVLSALAVVAALLSIAAAFVWVPNAARGDWSPGVQAGMLTVAEESSG